MPRVCTRPAIDQTHPYTPLRAQCDCCRTQEMTLTAAPGPQLAASPATLSSPHSVDSLVLASPCKLPVERPER